MLTATSLDIRLFGSPRFICEQSLAPALSAKALAVVAYLLLHRERVPARETVAFALWPDDPEENALANLRRALYLAQRALPPGEEWLLIDRKTIRWNAEAPYRLDVAEYETLAAAGDNVKAAALYSGELLQSFEDEWVQEPRAYYHAMQQRVLTSAIGQLRETGDLPAAAEMTRRALQFDPWNEEFIRCMMMLRAQSGDRAGALGEYRTFEALLQRELGAAPATETVALYERLRAGDVAAAPQRRRTHNLPAAVSTFVGRGEELREVEACLQAHRLVTLTGSGGVGKTRLALQVASQLQEHYADGVWFVDVTPLESQDALLQSIASVLKVHSRERLAEEIGEKQMLLVLDNCERAIAPCAAFAGEALSRCPNLRVLVTSRRRLRLAGETLYEVGALNESDAVALFYERSTSAGAPLVRTEETESTVKALCAQLERIPLAIELAAGRLRLLSLSQIRQRLSDRFALLRGSLRGTAPHHQTLRATIDWSYALLGEEERAVLVRLAVFSGASAIEAIAAVCEGCTQREMIDVLDELAEASLLIVVRGQNENRYRLLDSVREYLLGKLEESGNLTQARCSHLAYFTGLAEQLEPQLTRAGQERAMAALTADRDNLRAAFSWPAAGRDEVRMRLRLASALRWYYWFSGLFDLARERLSENLNAYGFESSMLYARALGTYGFFVLQQGDTQGARETLHSARAACPDEDTSIECALIELQLGLSYVFEGDEQSAARYLSAGLERARRLGDSWLLSYALALQGMHAGLSGRRTESVALLQEALALSEQSGESFQGTFWLLNLAVQQYYIDWRGAVVLFLRCARRAIGDENIRAVAGSFEGMAWCLQRARHFEEAAVLLGAAEELRVQTSQPLLAQWQAAHAQAIAMLDDPDWKSACAGAFETGAQMARGKRLDDLHARAENALTAPEFDADGNESAAVTASEPADEPARAAASVRAGEVQPESDAP